MTETKQIFLTQEELEKADYALADMACFCKGLKAGLSEDDKDDFDTLLDAMHKLKLLHRKIKDQL